MPTMSFVCDPRDVDPDDYDWGNTSGIEVGEAQVFHGNPIGAVAARPSRQFAERFECALSLLEGDFSKLCVTWTQKVGRGEWVRYLSHLTPAPTSMDREVRDYARILMFGREIGKFGDRAGWIPKGPRPSGSLYVGGDFT